MPESLEQFRHSFSYGIRNDLNFKFLKGLSDDDAADFLQQLLDRLGDSYDTGDISPLIEAAYEAQIRGYFVDPGLAMPYDAETGPFTPMTTPVDKATVGLLTTSGHFVGGDDPKPLGHENMTQAEAVDRIDDFLKDTPTLSSIPADTPSASLRVRHGGYDVDSSVLDPNVSFPMDRLAEAQTRGRIGGISATNWSFPGATAQGRLRKELPMWLDRIHEEHVDAIVLVPV